MLTSHNLFLFSKWGRFFLDDIVAGKAPSHLPSWFSFSFLPGVLPSSGAGPKITNFPHHSFLGRRHLISIGYPTSFVSTFYHEHAILSCPHSGSLMPVFPQGSLPRAGRSCAIPAQRLPASLLGFLGCHLLHKPLAHASLHTSFLSKAQNLFFFLYGPGSSFLHF